MAANTNNLPYAGFAYVLRNQNAEPFWDSVSQDVASFAAAIAENKREAWIIARLGDEYPRDMPDRDVLNDLITNHFNDQSLAVFQCENCGRLWVQEAPYSNEYRPFHPEGEWRDTLAVHQPE